MSDEIAENGTVNEDVPEIELIIKDKEVASLIDKLKLVLEREDDQASAALRSHLSLINGLLERRGTRFLTGDTMCCFDYELMSRLQHFRVAGKHFEVPKSFRALWRYMYHMYQLDAFTQSCPADQDIINHYKLQQEHRNESIGTKSHSKSANIRQDPKNVDNLVACNIVNTKQQQQDKIKIPEHERREGTSGISGQLYETKLLSLILFRALYVHKVKRFSLASNVKCMGAFDDIVFKFYSKEDNKCVKPTIIFVQAKHRGNPAKDKFTVEEIMKLNGDFSLHKYFESYLKISHLFDPGNNDDMFRDEFKNMDCEFIICTSAFEDFSKKKYVERTEGKRFINTSEGKEFQFDYDDQDVEKLVQTVKKSRAVLLAKRLTKFILEDNHSYMMMDDLIKTYHVFLARHILEVEVKDGDSQNNFRYAKFRESFFSSNDDLILAFKTTIKSWLSDKFSQEKNKNLSPVEQKEVENSLMSSSFKVPLDFGNLNFCFSGSEKKKEKRLKYLCSKFKQLFENVSANNVIKVDDNMVGPNKILKSTDLQSYRLGGLVGNLLVLDGETKTLKFSSDVDTLSEDNLKLLERLKSEVFNEKDLSKYRFDFNVDSFPRLSLIHDEIDKKMINDFLAKLFFYTNQAKEDEVEIILKKEIDNYFVSSIPRQSDALFRAKGDAMFLKVHDIVQKWWKQPIKAPNLTEDCKFFHEAEKFVLNSPLLKILNFTYIETMNNALSEIKFRESALELLPLDAFFRDTPRILCVTTDKNALTSIKLIQYFENQNFYDFSFIDLDYVVTGKYFEDAKLEIKESRTNTLIVVGNSKDVISEIHYSINNFKGKVIVICNLDVAHQIKKQIPTENIIEIVDSRIGFKDLADTMRTILLKERYIMFQGKEVPLGILFKDESYHLINSNLLCMIINNEKIKIGNFLNNPAYDKMLKTYINMQVCRYVTLDLNVQVGGEFNVLKYNELDDKFTLDTRDIILITDKYEEFVEFIKKHENCNVHWFSNGDKCLVWHKSRGNLMNIFKHINRGAHDAYKFQPVTLKDVKEKVVIISGEPGMGKSSLLTHLAIGTKHQHPTMWVSKINLLEYTNEFRRIKETKVSIDFKEAVKFLFRVIEFEAKLDPTMIDQVSVIGDDISLNKNNIELNFTGLNLFEIELFIHCYNNDRVILLFDGFDEICPDFANEFMQLINILKKSKVAHLWITSRLYNVLHQLENTLETFSFTILPLGLADQIEMLEKYLVGKVDFIAYDESIEKLLRRRCVESFLNDMSSGLRDHNHMFLSIPLHFYMLLEIFQDSFIQLMGTNVVRNINWNRLYELFVDVKFSKIRFGEKKPLLCVNDPDMRKLIDNERTEFINVHKIIAAHVIFCQSDDIQLFDDHDINARNDFTERIKVGEEKTGIIEQIIQNKPKFVHYTFAEYFAAEFLYDKLKSPHWKSSWTYFINTLLQNEKIGPLSFFNTKLENQPFMFNEMLNADVKEMFETLLLDHNKLAKLLFISIRNHFEDIAILLLKCVETVLSKKYLNDFINVVVKCPNMHLDSKYCILCFAVDQVQETFVAFVIELIKDLDHNRLIDLFYCSDYPHFNAITLGYNNCRFDEYRKREDWLNKLLANLPPPLIVELFCMQMSGSVIKFQSFSSNESLSCTSKELIESNILKNSVSLIHKIASLLGKNEFKCIDKALEKLNNEQLMIIFCAKDFENRLPAHIAAMEQAFGFFDKLESLLERSQFMKICMALDESGLTPIHYFKYTIFNCNNLQTLLNKVYEDNNDVKLTLHYFKDRREDKYF